MHHLLRALHRGRTETRFSSLSDMTSRSVFPSAVLNSYMHIFNSYRTKSSSAGTKNKRFALCRCGLQAVILNCAHSFCCHCIKQWRKKKDECPICRQAIQSQTRCLALDNCINSMVENLSLDMKARRQTLITERKGERCVTIIPVQKTQRKEAFL